MLKRIMYDLRLSSSCCVVLSMAAEDLLYLCPSMKCVTKCPLNSLKVETVFGRGKEVTLAVNKESARWTSLSKLVDTCALMEFIIMSIFYFIICISWAMHIALTSISKGWLVSFRPSFLLGMLLSSWSSLSCLPPMGRFLPF